MRERGNEIERQTDRRTERMRDRVKEKQGERKRNTEGGRNRERGREKKSKEKQWNKHFFHTHLLTPSVFPLSPLFLISPSLVQSLLRSDDNGTQNSRDVAQRRPQAKRN